MTKEVAVLGALLDALPASMQPVLFDRAAAQAAATAYRRAARVVGQAAAARAGDVGSARQDWIGPQRAQFDGAERGLAGDARALEAELRDCAGADERHCCHGDRHPPPGAGPPRRTTE